MTAIVRDNLPLGLCQLTRDNSISLELDTACCDAWFNVISRRHGVIFTVRRKGRHFYLSNVQHTVVVDFHLKGKMFEPPYMEVSFPGVGLPPLKVQQKGGLRSRSLLIVDHDDMPVLKVRPPQGFLTTSRTFLILGANDIEVGKMKPESIREWDLTFPQDLDLRCKVAVIGACMYYDTVIRSSD